MPALSRFRGDSWRRWERHVSPQANPTCLRCWNRVTFGRSRRRSSSRGRTPRHRDGGHMEATEEALVRQLADHDQELRGLYEEHLALKRRLEDFRHKLYLTTEEELEKKRIQKLKLASKDRMMAIVWRHQH